jgi:hypothetical protein
MKINIDLEAVYFPSGDVVAREIEGEIIIVPIVAGIGDMEDELYTLNATGRAIWMKLDGKKSLKIIAEELGKEFESSLKEVEGDVIGFVNELLSRKILVKTG